ncbi:Intraflagellar transport protein 46, partial [Globisporangium splendens]
MSKRGEKRSADDEENNEEEGDKISGSEDESKSDGDKKATGSKQLPLKGGGKSGSERALVNQPFDEALDLSESDSGSVSEGMLDSPKKAGKHVLKNMPFDEALELSGSVQEMESPQRKAPAGAPSAAAGAAEKERGSGANTKTSSMPPSSSGGDAVGTEMKNNPFDEEVDSSDSGESVDTNGQPSPDRTSMKAKSAAAATAKLTTTAAPAHAAAARKDDKPQAKVTPAAAAAPAQEERKPAPQREPTATAKSSTLPANAKQQPEPKKKPDSDSSSEESDSDDDDDDEDDGEGEESESAAAMPSGGSAGTGSGPGGGGGHSTIMANAGSYKESDFAHLKVSGEVRELFQYIGRFKSQEIELETRLKCFIPEYIPAVGDMDAFLEIPRPDGEMDNLGLKMLDEPSLSQSDATVLDLQLRSTSKKKHGDIVVRSIENAEKSAKEIDRWVKSIADLHRTKPLPQAHYTKTMPGVESLMQVASMDMALEQYIRVICALLDIPVYKNVYESLHVLFTLYLKFRSNQHFMNYDEQLENAPPPFGTSRRGGADMQMMVNGDDVYSRNRQSTAWRSSRDPTQQQTHTNTRTHTHIIINTSLIALGPYKHTHGNSTAERPTAYAPLLALLVLPVEAARRAQDLAVQPQHLLPGCRQDRHNQILVNMGNAVSANELVRAASLQQQLADLERTVQMRSAGHVPQWHAILPHQVLIDGAVLSMCEGLTYASGISARAGVRVLVGPVVGKVGCDSARILFEVDQNADVTCHVPAFHASSGGMREITQCRCTVKFTAGRPAVFHVKRLLPGRDYRFSFSGIDKAHASTHRGGFHTPSLETDDTSTIHAIAVSGNNMYDMERCEVNLWRDIKQRVKRNEVHYVLHLGGQVAMAHMFDQSYALLLRHASSSAPSWVEIEARAMDLLRSAYRTQWTAFRYVLAHAPNAMIWSDMDIYPAFTARPEFYIGHENSTIERQLWDDNMDELLLREQELIQIAGKALASTARIYQLKQQLLVVESELELQKKRREIEGARRVEKQLRALEVEKLAMEKQLVSYNQLLAPMRGEEFAFCIGEIGFLFLDLRSTRLEPGGSQAAGNNLMSTLQWEFAERQLESPSVQLWVVCSELPIVEASSEDLDRIAESSNSALEMRSWWGKHPESQERLLTLFFEWKMQAAKRDFVVLAGASCSGLRVAGRTTVNDVRLRTKADLYNRFEFEHNEVAYEKTLTTVRLAKNEPTTKNNSPSPSAQHVIGIQHVSVRNHAHELAKVLLGPVVGFVGDSSAVILLEVDRHFDVICVVTNHLTRETRRLYQHFRGRNPEFVLLDAFALRTLLRDHISEHSVTGHVQRELFDNAALSHSIGRDCATTLWGAMAEKVVEVPFSRIHPTIHLGGQFSVNDGNPFVQEATALADVAASDQSLEHWDATRIVEKLREMYRLAWNLPGVREVLVHGAYLMLSNTNDVLTLRNGTESGELVRNVLYQVHQQYQNLDATSRSVCAITTGKIVDSVYQYFTDPTKGGLNDYADFCPLNTGYTYGDCANPDNLTVPPGTSFNILGETHRATCRCTGTSLRSTDSSDWIVNQQRQTGCYAMECIANTLTIEITIAKGIGGSKSPIKVNCTAKGTKIKVAGFSGELTCPDPFTICGAEPLASVSANSGTSLQAAASNGVTQRGLVWTHMALLVAIGAWLTF